MLIKKESALILMSSQLWRTTYRALKRYGFVEVMQQKIGFNRLSKFLIQLVQSLANSSELHSLSPQEWRCVCRKETQEPHMHMTSKT